MAGRAPRPTGKSGSKPTGSSARRPASGRSGARRPSASQKPQPKPERGSRATNRLVILILVIGALVISFGSSLRAYLRQSAQIHQLEAQIEASKASIAASKLQTKRQTDPAYIEQQARLRFGWVMPGQTPYVVLGPDGQPLNSRAELDAQPPVVSTTPVPWWSKEASSWQAADNPPPTTKRTPATRITGQ